MSTTTLTHRPTKNVDPQQHNNNNTTNTTTSVEEIVQQVEQKIEAAFLKREVSRTSRILLTLSIVSSFLYWTALVHPFSGMSSFVL